MKDASILDRVAAALPSDSGEEPFTAQMVAERFGLTMHSAYQALSRLRQRGVAVKVEKSRGYRRVL